MEPHGRPGRRSHPVQGASLDPSERPDPLPPDRRDPSGVASPGAEPGHERTADPRRLPAAGGELRIRDARPEEREAIRELTLAAYSEYARVMEPTAWAALESAVQSGLATQEPVDWIVAELGGSLVGSVMLYPPAADAYAGAAARASWPELRLLSVSPEARGRGVGEALVEECVRRARRMGAAELGLHTSHSMRAAIRVYRRMGFVRAPEHDFHPAGAEVVEAYRRPLEPSGRDSETD